MFNKRHEEELAEIKALTLELGQRFDEILQELTEIRQAQGRLAGTAEDGKAARKATAKAGGAKAGPAKAAGAKAGPAKGAGAAKAGGPKAARAAGTKARRAKKASGPLAGQSSAARRKAAKRARAAAPGPGPDQE